VHLLVIYTAVILQTSLLYTARISWVPVLFADIPYLHEIFIVQYNEVAIELENVKTFYTFYNCCAQTVVESIKTLYIAQVYKNTAF